MHVLMLLAHVDFDPTESAIPWAQLSALGHEIHFATPDARPASADPRMLAGRGLGIWKPLLWARGGRATRIASPMTSPRCSTGEPADDVASWQPHPP